MVYLLKIRGEFEAMVERGQLPWRGAAGRVQLLGRPAAAIGDLQAQKHNVFAVHTLVGLHSFQQSRNVLEHPLVRVWRAGYLCID